MPYQVGEFPLLEGQEELLDFLRREFAAIEQSQVETQELELRVRNVEPSRPRAGMKVYADGTNWNPGDGAGSYTFDGTNWVKDIVADDLGALALLDIVDYDDVQDVTADRLLGRTGSDGIIEELVLGTNLSFSGNTLNAEGGSKIIKNWGVTEAFFPYTNFPQLDTRGSFFGYPILDYDDTVAEYSLYLGVMPDNYAGEDCEVEIFFAMTSATSGAVVWSVDFSSLSQGSIASNSFGAKTTDSITVSGTAGDVFSLTLTIDSADLDSLVAGDLFALSITREAADVGDTATDDAELIFVEMRIV